MFAANVIYQITVFSAMISITQVPYNALIMANERMNVYAYIEIVNVTLKLLIVFLLTVIGWDKLLTYGFLTLAVTFIIAMSYRVYCSSKLKNCRFVLRYDKEYVLPILSFSGWDLYGNMAVMARTQGVNMLLNMFFTATMNAASGIATQVQGAVMSFAGNVLAAIRPQIVKSYAQNDFSRMTMLITQASIFTTVLLLLFTIPLCVETDYVLTLWLKTPPPYTSVFVRYVLMFNVIANLATCVVAGIHATGRIKRSSFINGSLYLLVIPFAYISYKLNGEPQLAYLFNVIAVCGGLTQNVFCLSKFVPRFSKKLYFGKIFKCGLIGLLVYALAYELTTFLPPSFTRLLLTTVVSWCLLLITTFVLLLTENV